MRKPLFIVMLLLCSVFSALAAPLTFTLNRQVEGQVVSVNESSFADKYLLIAVGFTGCPDICPTTMLGFRNALKALDKYPKKAAQLQPLFLTIDPLSDSLDDITRYATFFDPRIVGLRATDFATLDNVVEQLHASYGYLYKGKPVLPPNLPKGYTVMHSGFTYLYSPTGELLDAFSYKTTGKQLAEHILTYIQ